MAEQKSKKGIFGRFIDILSGKPEEEQEPQSNEAPSSFAPQESEPTDLSFVKKFTSSGGKFLYCEDEGEAYNYIRLIMQESGLHKVYCKDPNLISILRKAGVDVQDQLNDCDSFCSNCEYLVSFNGGIMISANQLQGKKLDELPDTFITIGKTSQITDNLRSALAGIRIKYQNNLPSQITTIKGPKKVEEIEENDLAKICNKEIYLLLLEDQL